MEGFPWSVELALIKIHGNKNLKNGQIFFETVFGENFKRESDCFFTGFLKKKYMENF